MKPREILYLLGFRSGPKTYGYQMNTFALPKDGPVQYAQWLHPKQTETVISQAAVDELGRFLSPGDVAIDIGAHTGDTTIPIALAVGVTGCVLAIEPNKYVFPFLKKNSELNPDKTNIVPLMLAATPADGEYEFEYSDPGLCNGGLHEGISKRRHCHAFKLKVQGMNLQSHLEKNYPDLLPRIRFIKVDAEGYDYAILATLSQLISTQKPYIKAEFFKLTSHGQRQKLYQFLSDHGYTIYRIKSDADYMGETVERQNLMRWRQFDVFCVPHGAAANRDPSESAHGILRRDTKAPDKADVF